MATDALVLCGGRGTRLRESLAARAERAAGGDGSTGATAVDGVTGTDGTGGTDGVDGTTGAAASEDDSPVEKPLVTVAGRPMVERVIDALAGTPSIGTVHAATAPDAPRTRDRLRERGDVRVVETPGEGYVADLTAALADRRVIRPVVTAVADLPLLAPDAVETALDRADGGARDLAVCVPVALKEALGVSVDRTRDPAGAESAGSRPLAPTGLNVIGADDGREAVHATWDARLAVNVNYAADAAVAEWLAGAEGGVARGSR